MSARKIRQTQVGLVAMPDMYDERYVTADHLARDRYLCTALHTLLGIERDVDDYMVCRPLGKAWLDALNAANENDIDELRAALTRARDAAADAGYSTEHEDAALAMLPPVAGRRAA